uniref:U6-Deinotoxin-Dsu1a_1 n=1 Tax=Deinopis subrufa TaxID=1905329 RepID=A0A4Q8K8V0_DEISU
MKFYLSLLLMGITLLFATIDATEGEYTKVEEQEQERECIAKYKRCGLHVSVNPCCRGTSCKCHSIGLFEKLCNCKP